MAAKKKTGKTKAKPTGKAGAKPKTGMNTKAKATKAKSKPPKAKSKRLGAKPAITTRALAAVSDDPMGCCTFTDSSGHLQTRDMKKSQCGKIAGSTFEAGVQCNG